MELRPTAGDCWSWTALEAETKPLISYQVGFSKKLQNHEYMVGLYALWYNFVRIHKTLRTSPAMAVGIETRLWSMEDVVALADERAAKITGETLVGA